MRQQQLLPPAALGMLQLKRLELPEAAAMQAAIATQWPLPARLVPLMTLLLQPPLPPPPLHAHAPPPAQPAVHGGCMQSGLMSWWRSCNNCKLT